MCLDFSVLMARVRPGAWTLAPSHAVFGLALHHNNLDEDFFVIITTLVRPSQLRDGHLNPKKGQTKSTGTCLKILSNFRGYGSQITHGP